MSEIIRILRERPNGELAYVPVNGKLLMDSYDCAKQSIGILSLYHPEDIYTVVKELPLPKHAWNWAIKFRDEKNIVVPWTHFSEERDVREFHSNRVIEWIVKLEPSILTY